MWVLKNSATGEYIKTRKTTEGGGHGEGHFTCLHIDRTTQLHEARIWVCLHEASLFVSRHQERDYGTWGDTKGFTPVKVVMKEAE